MKIEMFGTMLAVAASAGLLVTATPASAKPQLVMLTGLSSHFLTSAHSPKVFKFSVSDSGTGAAKTQTVIAAYALLNGCTQVGTSTGYKLPKKDPHGKWAAGQITGSTASCPTSTFTFEAAAFTWTKKPFTSGATSTATGTLTFTVPNGAKTDKYILTDALTFTLQ